EEGGEDQHALAVDRAPEVGLALDVEQLALAERGGRGDPARMTEELAAELVDREPVDLADPLAIGGDGERALDDGSPIDLGRARRAVTPAGDGAHDVAAIDLRTARGPRIGVRLDRHLGEMAELGADAMGVLRLAGAFVDEAGERAARERQQAPTLRLRPDGIGD